MSGKTGYNPTMRHTKSILALLAAFAVPSLAVCADAATEQAPNAATDLQPDVTIVDGSEERISEYRIAGRLYMIKVTPKKGREYYLVDSDGDGHMDIRRNELAPNLLIPTWVLIKW